jgi:LmbE family N-acetylglucosaminyl deacetylase
LPRAADQDPVVTAAEPSLPPPPVLWRRVPAGRVLAFAPHPDDEVAGPGGALALHAAQGDAVRVVVATDGTSGDPDGRHSPTFLAILRQRESLAGLGLLGVDDVRFWGFPDGHVLSATDLQNVAALAAREIAEFRPDVVYLPWELDGHPDHHRLHVVVTRALDATGFRGLAMVPDVIVETTSVFPRKQAAMLAHASQIAYTQYDHCLGGLAAYRSLAHLRGRGYGEAFRRVRGSLPASLAEPT